MIHWESLLERDAIMLFEFSPGVASYREQPFSTYFFFEGRMRRYTPDFEITFPCGRVELIEVKPSSKIQRADVQIRFQAIQSHFKALGCSLRFVTDVHIRRGALLKNLFTIYGYRTPSLSDHEVKRSKELLSEVPPLTVGSAIKVLGSERTFWQMVAANTISVQLRAEITADTACTFNEDGAPNEEIYF